MSNTNKDIEVNVRERITTSRRRLRAVGDPEKMSNHVISAASAPMTLGPVTWEFGDFWSESCYQCARSRTQQEDCVGINRARPTNAIHVAVRSPDGENAKVVTVTECLYAFTPEGVKLALGQNAG